MTKNLLTAPNQNVVFLKLMSREFRELLIRPTMVMRRPGAGDFRVWVVFA